MKQSIIDAISQQLVQHYEIPESEVHPNITYSDLGVDSLALVELAIHIQNLFALSKPVGMINDKQTISESAKIIAELA